MNSSKFYTDEMIEFIRENAPGLSQKELTARFNSHFSTNKTVKQIAAVCGKHKIRSYTNSFYTDEMINFLRSNIAKSNHKELTKEFNKRFNTNKTVQQIASICARHRIRSIRKTIYPDEMLDFLRANIVGTRYTDLTDMFNTRFNTTIKEDSIKRLCNEILGIKNMLGRTAYSEKMISFLKENADGKSHKELTDLFNTTFETNKTVKQIRGMCAKNKICSNTKSFYTEEMITFLRNNIHIKSWDKITEYFNTEFCVNKTKKEIQYACGNRGIFPHGFFQRGERRSLGTEIINDGYVYVKVKHPDVWIAKHRMLWERNNGPLPNGYCVIFADCNTRNFDESNLIKVSREELSYLNSHNLRFNNPEYTKVGINIIKVIIKTKERQKELDNEKSKKKNQ